MRTFKFSLIAAMLCCAGASLAQTVNFNNHQYVRSGSTWLQQDPTVSDGLEVQSEVITIRFKSTVAASAVSSLLDMFGLSLLRENKLGYIDCTVPEGVDVMSLAQELSANTILDYVGLSVIGSYGYTPNDPDYSNQYGLQSNRMRANDAWDITPGSSSVTVGVLDSGTDWLHEDLGMGIDGYQNIYLNSGEDAWSNPNDPTSGNGIDDDGNGFIDDWKGWNFDSNTPDARTSTFHGTHVAGVLAAKTNNGKGISGMAGGKNAAGTKMLTVCVGTNFPISAIMDDAIIYATDIGVKIIQLSLTLGSSPIQPVDDAIEYANSKGVIIINAAGNGGGTIRYPSSNSLVFSVGGTNQSDSKAPFADFGSNLDISAPAVSILSTQLNNTYGSSNGTSFASPAVSGVAALLLSVKPCLTPAEIKGALRANADKVGAYDYSYNQYKPRHSLELGYGRLNAFRAVSEVNVQGSDIYLHDNPEDYGGESNYTEEQDRMWISSSIRVSSEEGTPFEQAGLEMKYYVAKDNYVLLKIKNRGDQMSQPSTVQVYFNKASTSSRWPESWDGTDKHTNGEPLGGLLGEADVEALAPCQEVVVEIPVQAPDPLAYGVVTEPNHFCLLARIIETGKTNGGLNETACTWCNIFNNNNVASANFTIIGDSDNPQGIILPGGGTGTVTVGNFSPTAVKRVKIGFEVPNNELANPVTDFGTVKIQLTKALFDKWDQQGRQGSGIKATWEMGTELKQILGRTIEVPTLLPVLTINQPKANIVVTLQPSETHTVAMKFNQDILQTLNPAQTFHYDVVQYEGAPGSETIVGGEHYVVNNYVETLDGIIGGAGLAKQGENPEQLTHWFNEENKDDQLLTYPNPAHDELTLSIKRPEENATYSYVMFDMSGKLVHEGAVENNKTTIQVSNLVKGLYSVILINDLNKSEHKKIVQIK